MGRKIRTGVIGCGKVGDFHAKAYKELESSELVAVCNHNIDRAKAMAEKYGVRAFDSLDRMVEETGVEAVSICTPHPAHAADAVRAAELGVNIAIEKPLAVTIEDCNAIVNAAERNHIVGTTISQRRFYEPTIRMQEAIRAGKIGKPILGTVTMLGWRDMAYYGSDPWRGTWQREGGGVLVNQAVHQLDLLLAFMGEMDEVYGMWDTFNHPGLEVEDTAAAVIRFKSGAIGNVVVSNSQNPALYGRVHVHGSNGASIGVKTDGGAMYIAGVSPVTEPPVNDLWTIRGEEDRLALWQKEDYEQFRKVDFASYFHTCQLDDFLAAIIEGRKPRVTLEDGRAAVALFVGIYRSQRDHRPVKFPLEEESGADFDGRLPRRKY